MLAFVVLLLDLWGNEHGGAVEEPFQLGADLLQGRDKIIDNINMQATPADTSLPIRSAQLEAVHDVIRHRELLQMTWCCATVIATGLSSLLQLALASGGGHGGKGLSAHLLLHDVDINRQAANIHHVKVIWDALLEHINQRHQQSRPF